MVRLHLFESKGSNFPEGVVIVIIKKGLKVTQLNHEDLLSRSATQTASPLLLAIAYNRRNHFMPKDKPKRGVETLRDHQKKRGMQVNNFGLQDPHRFTTVAFDSVGTRYFWFLMMGQR